MSKADSASSTNSLSSLTDDPVLKAFFERSERGAGNTFAVSTGNKPVITGGAVRVLEPAGA